MKIREFLKQPLLSEAVVLAGKNYLDQNFTWCCRGDEELAASPKTPGYLMIYEGRKKEETWNDYVLRMKASDAAGILFISRRKNDFDIEETEYLCCEENGIPLIWIPGNNVTMFMTRIQPFLKEEFRISQRTENWLYNLCYKNHFADEAGVEEEYGYHSQLHYYCVMLKISGAVKMGGRETERRIIQAENILKSYPVQAGAEVLLFSEKDAIISFIPVTPESPFEKVRKVCFRIANKVREITTAEWDVIVGTKAEKIEDFSVSFQDTLKTAHIASCFGCNTGIEFWEDWQTSMLPLYAPYPELKKFLKKWIDPITQYEGLLDTLTMYIITKRNVRETATALNIHQSTLKYRLKKIGDILECDLNDLHTFVSLQMAVICNGYLNGVEDVSRGYLEKVQKNKNLSDLEMRGKYA